MPGIDRRALYERDGGLCGFCRESVDPELFHVDHVIPRAKGGGSDPSNLRIAHPRCNIAAGKSARAGSQTKWAGPTVALTIRGVSTAHILAMRQEALATERSLNFIAARLLREALDKGHEKRGR